MKLAILKFFAFQNYIGIDRYVYNITYLNFNFDTNQYQIIL